MRRIGIIGICFVLTFGAFTVGARAMLDTRALAAADELYYRRTVFENVLLRAADTDRHVLVLGDSTLVGTFTHPSWPVRIAPQLRQRGIDVVVAAEAGRDFFHHYCLLPAFLEHDPDVVVIVANLRIFPRARRAGRNIDFCSHLPPPQWPSAAMLPWHDRGVTLLRVALARLLDAPWVEEWFLFAEGSRRMFAETIGTVRQRSDGARAAGEISRGEGLTRAAHAYAIPMTERHPIVAMMRATVEMGVRHGASVIIVVAPAPLAQIESFTGWEHTRFEERTAMLRRVVEAAGGEFVDLHGLLPRSGFRDTGGHYRPSGHTRVANAVAGRVHRALRIPPPKLLPVLPDP